MNTRLCLGIPPSKPRGQLLYIQQSIGTRNLRSSDTKKGRPIQNLLSYQKNEHLPLAHNSAITRNRPSNKRHSKQNVAAAMSRVPPPLAEPKLIMVKNRQHRCHTAKGDFSVSQVLLYNTPLSISHMTFQQYFDERRVKHYRGGDVGKRGF